MDVEAPSSVTVTDFPEGGDGMCTLCGTTLGRFTVDGAWNGRTLSFCCHGCRMVFEILFQRPGGPPEDYRQTDLYRACIEAGIVPRRAGESPAAVEPLLGTGSLEHEKTEDIFRDTLELTFRVAGMWCVTCGVLVESVLRGMPGVVDARVSFFSDSAHVRYLPHLTSPGTILDRVSRLGYSAVVHTDESSITGERRSLQIRLGVAAILTANVMMISWALYFGFFQELTEEEVRFLSWPLWLLSTPVVFHAGAPILKKAFRGVRWGAVSLETLIAVGCLSAYGFSMLQMLAGSLHVYFDTASMLVTLVLLGRTIEAGARERVSRGVTDLLDSGGAKVRVIRDGREVWTASGAVAVGEEYAIGEGERVPIDGRVVAGTAHVDESFLTGESRPVFKGPGDEILTGSRVLGGGLRARVVRPVRESLLEQMITIIRNALDAKTPGEQTADRCMRWIVPTVLVLACMTAAWVRAAGAPLEEAWQRGLAVLVITCPCALGIAVPLAKVATIGAGRRRGLIFRDFDALERVASLNTYVFDKTGTVTEGAFTWRGLETFEAEETEVLRRLGAVEAFSDHLIAREVVRQCRERGLTPGDCRDFTEFEGRGVSGVVAGEAVRVGNRRFMLESGCDIPRELDEKALQQEKLGMTTSFFAWDGKVQGFLWLGDSVRPDSLPAVRTLQTRGARIVLLSGDSDATTRAVAELLEICEVRASMLPADKADFVKALQTDGGRVGMVGDGINDAPALARADVAFTVGTGAELLREVSGVTLLKGEMSLLLDAIAMAKFHGRIAAQNLFFAFAYNGVAIPVAMAGYLNPMLAVVAMFLSSLTVIANTLRIK